MRRGGERTREGERRVGGTRRVIEEERGEERRGEERRRDEGRREERDGGKARREEAGNRGNGMR